MKMTQILGIIAVVIFLVPMFAQAQTTTANDDKAVVSTTVEQTNQAQIMQSLLGFLEVGKETLQDGITMAKNGVEKAGKFAGTELPFVLAELVLIRRVETAILFLVTIGLGIAVFSIGRRLWKWIREDLRSRDSDGGYASLSILLQIVAVLLPIAIILSNLRTFILPWFAPRIYLIEYTVQLIEKLRG